ETTSEDVIDVVNNHSRDEMGVETGKSSPASSPLATENGLSPTATKSPTPVRVNGEPKTSSPPPPLAQSAPAETSDHVNTSAVALTSSSSSSCSSVASSPLASSPSPTESANTTGKLN